MNKINEIKLPEGVDRISVTQHDDKLVIEFIPEEPKFKRGDFVYEDGRIMIVKDYPNSYYALIYPKSDMEPVYNGRYALIYNGRYALTMSLSCLFFRYATEEEKQLLIDAMREDGKRWNAEKKCIEDIPKRKFKAGDKVTLKSRCISKTGLEYLPLFDRYIGKRLEVVSYTESGHVQCDNYFYFHEDWLEPWIDEPKNGDLAIFWDNKSLMPLMPLIRLYHGKTTSGNSYIDNFGTPWDNAVKWDGTKEQFEKVLRGDLI